MVDPSTSFWKLRRLYYRQQTCLRGIDQTRGFASYWGKVEAVRMTLFVVEIEANCVETQHVNTCKSNAGGRDARCYRGLYQSTFFVSIRS